MAGCSILELSGFRLIAFYIIIFGEKSIKFRRFGKLAGKGCVCDNGVRPQKLARQSGKTCEQRHCMNTETIGVAKADPFLDEKHELNLLDRIRSMRVELGDELNDEEFTRLAREAKLPAEAGFAFLGYCSRYVMLTVPRQDPTNWYREKGWLKPEKEKIAKEIAEKYGFAICEPPDMKDPSTESPNPRHHLQLSNQHEAIVIIHPQFLKIRLFGLASHSSRAQKPLHKKCELLQDLAKLFKS